MRDSNVVHKFVVNGQEKMCNQITIGAARREFYKGTEIYAIPCKLHINNKWQPPMRIELDIKEYELKLEMFKWKQDHGFKTEAVEYFDSIVNKMIYYNCNKDTGYYLRYFKVI